MEADKMDEFNNQSEPTSPVREYHHTPEPAPVVSLGEWIVTLLIMSVPLLNVIMIIIWAADSKTNPNKSNWAKATLIIVAIQIILLMFFIGTIIGSVSELMSGMGKSGLW